MNILVSVLYSTEHVAILLELDGIDLMQQCRGIWAGIYQHTVSGLHWCCLVNMEHTRLNKRVFNWAASRAGGKIKN